MVCRTKYKVFPVLSNKFNPLSHNSNGKSLVEFYRISTIVSFAQTAGTVEYTDCFSEEG